MMGMMGIMGFMGNMGGDLWGNVFKLVFTVIHKSWSPGFFREQPVAAAGDGGQAVGGSGWGRR